MELRYIFLVFINFFVSFKDFTMASDEMFKSQSYKRESTVLKDRSITSVEECKEMCLKGQYSYCKYGIDWNNMNQQCYLSKNSKMVRSIGWDHYGLHTHDSKAILAYVVLGIALILLPACLFYYLWPTIRLHSRRRRMDGRPVHYYRGSVHLPGDSRIPSALMASVMHGRTLFPSVGSDDVFKTPRVKKDKKAEEPAYNSEQLPENSRIPRSQLSSVMYGRSIFPSLGSDDIFEPSMAKEAAKAKGPRHGLDVGDNKRIKSERKSTKSKDVPREERDEDGRVSRRRRSSLMSKDNEPGRQESAFDKVHGHRRSEGDTKRYRSSEDRQRANMSKIRRSLESGKRHSRKNDWMY